MRATVSSLSAKNRYYNWGFEASVLINTRSPINATPVNAGFRDSIEQNYDVLQVFRMACLVRATEIEHMIHPQVVFAVFGY